VCVNYRSSNRAHGSLFIGILPGTSGRYKCFQNSNSCRSVSVHALFIDFYICIIIEFVLNLNVFIYTLYHPLNEPFESATAIYCDDKIMPFECEALHNVGKRNTCISLF